MKNLLAPKTDNGESYRLMESSAGTYFLALLALVVISWVYLQPSLLYALSCLGTGVFLFIANIQATEEKTSAAFGFFAIGTLIGVAFIPWDMDRSSVLLVAVSHGGLSLFGLIAIRKLLRAQKVKE